MKIVRRAKWSSVKCQWAWADENSSRIMIKQSSSCATTFWLHHCAANCANDRENYVYNTAYFT